MEPVSVAAINDYDLVVEGLAAMLERDARLVVRERIVVGEPLRESVDVALYDTFGSAGDAAATLAALRDDPMVGRVVVFSLELQRSALEQAVAAGAAGYISKRLSGAEIADAVVRIAAGEYVEAVGATASANPELDWPGRDHGLTQRESEVLMLASDGLTNAEIGAVLYIGSETVKSHLRSVFSKLRVRNRVEATAFARGSESFRRLDVNGRSGPVDGRPRAT